MKKFFTSALSLAALFLFMMMCANDALAQPANDACANAIAITVNGGATSFSNINATNGGQNPTCGGTNIQDVWFTFVYPGGSIQFDAGVVSNSDPRIAVWTACGGTQIACDDDSGPGNASRITLTCTTLTAGITYYIQAGGFNALEENYTLTLTGTGATGCSDPAAMNYTGGCVGIDDGSCQYNDICATAEEIIPNAGPVLTTNANTIVDGPEMPCGGAGIKDVWFYFVYNGGEVNITTTLGTNNDTRIAVYSACGGAVLGCDDDNGPGNASLISFACDALTIGNTYYIQAGGYNAIEGTFTISVNADPGTCIPGMSCDTAFPAVLGVQTAPLPNTWYSFVPDASGQWKVSTCGLATCDTGIWLYDHCNMDAFDDSNVATVTFNDDFCGVQSEITPLLAAGQIYYIRIGSIGGACPAAPLDFLIEYIGPWLGCMDINACNFDPVATVPGTCYYNGDPNCDDLGPDLEVQQGVLFSTLVSTTINATDACLFNEGCVQGLGTRQVLRFTTHIKNIGNQDYFIGVPGANNPQFEYDECHNHYHYEGYANYQLYDTGGNLMPQIGFKNGFCVLDLECAGGGIAKYGCGNMGITAGCGDYYSSNLSCQWVDITDVPAGDYYLVVKTNWDQSPDQAGNYELRYDNNYGYVCIHFDRDANNNIINFTKNNTCPILEDCIGIPFGESVPDCQGTCPGIVKRGDVDNDFFLSEGDVHEYLEASVEGGITPSSCTDLNNDGEISVADAVYMHTCIHAQEELGVLPEDITDCPWDDEIVNPFETTELGIATVNTTLGYADVYIVNPNLEMLGLEFEVSGITISSVESLVDPLLWTPDIHFTLNGNRVTVLSENEPGLPKYASPGSILRLYYSSYTAAEVCVSNIIDAVDFNTHNTLTLIGDCQDVLIDFANFSASQTEICEDESITFTDLSTQGANNWNWEFQGAEPFNSTDQNPVVTYSNPGTYQVTLVAGNGIISDNEVKTAYITVNAKTAWYLDEDNDGFGNDAVVQMSCATPVAHVADNTDCDDFDNDTYPGAPGLADDVDRNCNGQIDPEEALPNPCLGDFNGDGVINTTDLLIFLGEFGCTSGCGQADLNNDGSVNTSDLLLFLGAYGTFCE